MRTYEQWVVLCIDNDQGALMLIEPGDRRIIGQRDGDQPRRIGRHKLGFDPTDAGSSVEQHQPCLVGTGGVCHRIDRRLEDLADLQCRGRHRRDTMQQAQPLDLILCAGKELRILHTERDLRTNTDEEPFVALAERIRLTAGNTERTDRCAIVGQDRDAEIRAHPLGDGVERLHVKIDGFELLDITAAQRAAVADDPTRQRLGLVLRRKCALLIDHHLIAVEHQYTHSVAIAMEQRQARAVGTEHLAQHAVDPIDHRAQLER